MFNLWKFGQEVHHEKGDDGWDLVFERFVLTVAYEGGTTISWDAEKDVLGEVWCLPCLLKSDYCFQKMDYIKMKHRRDISRRSLHLVSRFCFFPFQGLWSALRKTDLTLRSALFILYLPNPIPPYKNYKEHCVFWGNLLFNYANMTNMYNFITCLMRYLVMQIYFTLFLFYLLKSPYICTTNIHWVYLHDILEPTCKYLNRA